MAVRRFRKHHWVEQLETLASYQWARSTRRLIPPVSRVANFGGVLNEVTDVAVQSNNDVVAVGYSSSTNVYGAGGNVEVLRLLPMGFCQIPVSAPTD